MGRILINLDENVGTYVQLIVINFIKIGLVFFALLTKRILS